jgi:H+/Cl- antiporter ClcA
VVRVLGPVLALGTGIPGGLIDPAFAFGALLGRGVGELAGVAGLGLALGMTAGLAGATQLPVITVLFALRLAGDQQLLPGMLVASVLAALVSRLVLPQPIYHALAEVTRPAP